MKDKAKILFACLSMEGHFNPLSGLAVHLKSQGYDVRWFAGDYYRNKINKLGIEHYPFKYAKDISPDNVGDLIKQREGLSQIKKLQFDMENLFIADAENHLKDIEQIHKTFPFEILISDMLYTASLLVKEKLGVSLVGIGISPLATISRDLPPPGLGLFPAESFFGKMKQGMMRFVTSSFIFKGPRKTYNAILTKHNVKPVTGIFFADIIHRSDVYLQSGVPGFEYKRSDIGSNVKFVGALLPFNTKRPVISQYNDKIALYKKVILVTQGTAEPDSSKLIIPTLEAFKDTDSLVIATTAGSNTEKLREAYPQQNIIIEDFIDFHHIMPLCNVFITNGGYGGVLLSITNDLPMVAAGVHEGKNEITARIGYFKIGIQLKTERPSAEEILQSVSKILTDPVYKSNVVKLSSEFKQYDTMRLCEKHIEDIIKQRRNSR